MKYIAVILCLTLLCSCASRRKSIEMATIRTDSVVATHTENDIHFTDSCHTEELIVIDSVTTADGVKVFGVKLKRRVDQLTRETEKSCTDSLSIISEENKTEICEENRELPRSPVATTWLWIFVALFIWVIYLKS